MGIFNWFGEQEHHVFDYKPRYYDKEKEKIKDKFSAVDGSDYEPGKYVRGSLRDGRYNRQRTHGSKAQNIIGLIGLILVVVVLIYIAKFYTLL